MMKQVKALQYDEEACKALAGWHCYLMYRSLSCVQMFETMPAHWCSVYRQLSCSAVICISSVVAAHPGLCDVHHMSLVFGNCPCQSQAMAELVLFAFETAESLHMPNRTCTSDHVAVIDMCPHTGQGCEGVQGWHCISVAPGSH